MAKDSINRSTKNVTVAKDCTPQVMEAFREAMKEVVDTACEDCKERAKTNLAAVGAVDTGAGRESIYVSLPGKDGFNEAVARALALRPKSTWFTRPRSGYGRVDYASNRSYYAGFVAVAAEYLRYIEQGKVNVPARPFLAPAIAKTNAEFREKAKETMNRLLGKATK